MKGKNNQGVSLIEILIAVVVFVICIIPIITQLASGIRIGQRADDQQAATDYAKSLVETVKQMPLQDTYTASDLAALSDNLNVDSSTITVSRQYYSVKADGTAGTQVTAATYDPDEITDLYKKINTYNMTASQKEALVREFVFKGSSTNVDYRDYNVTIRMNTLPYAMAELNSTEGYEDPNSVNLRNLSSLDVNTTAIITQASTYDITASNAFYTAIVSGLEKSDDENDRDLALLIKNGQQTIEDDIEKRITITVDPLSDPTKPYRVTCQLTYQDVNDLYDVLSADEEVLTYVAFQQEFKELPPIYLMYNEFLYETNYGDDVIYVQNNLSGEKIKVYVIRTAENNSKVADLSPDNLTAAPGGTPATPQDLIPQDTAGYRDEKSGTNFMNTVSFMVGGTGLDITAAANANAMISETAWNQSPVEIYTNILVGPDDAEGNPTLQVVSGPPSGLRNSKLSVNANFDVNKVVKSLDQDERYSEQGRIYNIVVELENTRTGNVTTFDTSKGDY